ncbi:MAG: FKBP-type peptidyl-prolyl cis-trans isomerase, partial [Lachnospiraceae bacterium]|nr:FKBP-type peptidyl-prolyl cis-trans isomerase [Lachnospiraceae bacterium]
AFSGCGSSAGKTGDASTAQEAAENEEEALKEDSASESDLVAEADMKLEVSDKTLEGNKAADFVKIGDYKGMELTLPEDTAAAEGMTANIAFAGTVVGEDAPRDGMTSDSYDLVLGSGSFIPGFEDALIGHKAGEEVKFTIPFPDDYGEETLAGKDTDWTVTIHSLSNGGINTAFSKFVNDAEISSLPKDIYGDATEYVTAIYKTSADGSGVTLDEFLSTNGIDLEKVIRSEVRSWLTSLAILEQEGITKESAEYTAMLSDILSVYGYQTLEEAVEAGYPEAFLTSVAQRQAALKIVQDNSK